MDPAAALRLELRLLRQRWHVILGGLLFQYVHGIFTQIAYRMHRPAASPLHDVGFALLPELQPQHRWLSEAIFTCLLCSFVAWTFSPLALTRRFSTAVLWARLLAVLVACQVLRILSFSSTQLPGPAPHCRGAAATANRPWVDAWWQHLLVDVRRQLAHSCGDLIFSSHMTFILAGVLAYNHYGSRTAIKAALWAAAALLGALIIAARKHYTVDVVIAWYTVPMVYTLLHVHWQQQQQQQQQQLAGIALSSGWCDVAGSCSICGSAGRCSDSNSGGDKLGFEQALPVSVLVSARPGGGNGSTRCCGCLGSGASCCAACLQASLAVPPMWWLPGGRRQHGGAQAAQNQARWRPRGSELELGSLQEDGTAEAQVLITRSPLMVEVL